MSPTFIITTVYPIPGDPRLLAHVRPPEWRNPAPASRYDLVVIGGGTAGLVCAAGAASLGARVALAERHLLGGDCLNAGCVPSKALIAAARSAASQAGSIRSPIDFAAVMTRVREARVALAPNDSAARLQALGVDVFFGAASFMSDSAIEVGGLTLRFRRAVIATGSRPTIPPVPGLADRTYFTNETIFEIATQPGELLILGGGAVGCELAQAFARLGTRVTIVERAARILPSEDPDAARIVADNLSRVGVEIRMGMTEPKVSVAEAVLVAVGRTPNVDQLGLERAGINFDTHGIEVDDRLRTTNPRVYAAGDVCPPSRTRFGAASSYRFTHAADAMARIVVQNALFFGRRRFSDLVIPWCTFTDPEIGHVGITPDDAARRGAATITVSLSDVDRAVIEAQTEGFIRVHHDRGRILGATIVAPDAGNLISVIVAVMQKKGTLSDLSAAVFPYPTMALALKRAGDLYRRERVTPGLRRVLRYYFRSRT
jgi:pyruvate/2-oxoglutarate dehydrogenase complex dihydrolipoamide dehydrogenase (E3) component